MKKWWQRVMSLGMVVLLFGASISFAMPQTVLAYSEEEEDESEADPYVEYTGSDIYGISWTYTLSPEGNATLVDTSATQKPTIQVPVTIDGHPVEELGCMLFQDDENLTSLVIPKGVKTIGVQACYHCPKLNSVSIPESVTSIGSFAFGYCTGLTSIVLPNGLTTIEAAAFEGATGLKNITFPSSLTHIRFDAFKDTKWLKDKSGLVIAGDGVLIKYKGKAKSVTLPDTVKYIGDGAFESNRTLTKITTTKNLKEIGDFAFLGCTSLKTVVLKKGLLKLGYDSFEDCTKLTTMTIPSTVNSIETNCFFGTKWYKNLKAKSTFVILGDHLLYEYTGNSKTVTIPTGVKYIATRAFDEKKLTKVIIPKTVKTIYPVAFAHCEKLTTVVVKSGVKSIGQSAFVECAIKSITIPASVTSLGDSIVNGENIPYGGVILGTPGTAAEAYAKSHTEWTFKAK